VLSNLSIEPNAPAPRAHETEGHDTSGLSSGRLLGGLGLLILFAAITCAALLSRGPAMGDHECINAVAARQALEGGHLLIPQVNGAPWVRKPPLGTWLIALSSSLLEAEEAIPVSDFTARLPSAIAGILNVLAVFWLGTMMFKSRPALVAGFITAGCVGTIFYARNAQVDMVMSAFTTLAFACFWRGTACGQPSTRALMGFYVALAVAMMAKAPLPLAIVGGALFIYWFVVLPLSPPAGASDGDGPRPGPGRQLVERVGGLRKLHLAGGGVILLVLCGLWPLYVWWKIPGAMELWRIEYLDRASGDLSDRPQPWYYYLPILLALLAPYTFSLGEALAAPFVGWYREQRRGLLYAFTWAVFGTLFLSIAAFKRPHYLLPVLPAYALLLGPVIDRIFFGRTGILFAERRVRLLAWATPVLVVLALVVGGFVLHRRYPDILPAYLRIAGVLAVVWAMAAGLYLAGRRGLSFAGLNLGIAVATLVTWPAVAPHLDSTPEADALAAEMRKLGLSGSGEIFWVGRRPKATLEFYAHLTAKRLITDLELAAMRTNREDVSDDLLREYARRIQEQLRRPEPVYLVMESGNYYMFEHNTGIKARVLAELHGFNQEPGEDLIVVTQAAGPPSSAPVASHPG
jgi:4-amino-4-deoxy-L-arabinose transferase-like glycosyltransferase